MSCDERGGNETREGDKASGVWRKSGVERAGRFWLKGEGVSKSFTTPQRRVRRQGQGNVRVVGGDEQPGERRGLRVVLLRGPLSQNKQGEVVAGERAPQRDGMDGGERFREQRGAAGREQSSASLPLVYTVPACGPYKDCFSAGGGGPQAYCAARPRAQAFNLRPRTK